MIGFSPRASRSPRYVPFPVSGTPAAVALPVATPLPVAAPPATLKDWIVLASNDGVQSYNRETFGSLQVKYNQETGELTPNWMPSTPMSLNSWTNYDRALAVKVTTAVLRELLGELNRLVSSVRAQCPTAEAALSREMERVLRDARVLNEYILGSQIESLRSGAGALQRSDFSPASGAPARGGRARLYKSRSRA